MKPKETFVYITLHIPTDIPTYTHKYVCVCACVCVYLCEGFLCHYCKFSFYSTI